MDVTPKDYSGILSVGPKHIFFGKINTHQKMINVGFEKPPQRQPIQQYP